MKYLWFWVQVRVRIKSNSILQEVQGFIYLFLAIKIIKKTNNSVKKIHKINKSVRGKMRMVPGPDSRPDKSELNFTGRSGFYLFLASPFNFQEQGLKIRGRSFVPWPEGDILRVPPAHQLYFCVLFIYFTFLFYIFISFCSGRPLW